jgi:murein DD-endopeptidase MepM/ murein hydrolase activator NlpD
MNQKPARNILNYMRKLLFLFAAIIFVVAFRVISPEAAGSLARRVTLPFKLALLSAEEPDREIAVPVDGVPLGRIKDSWHAPRAGGRLHEGQDIFAERGTIVYSATRGYVVRKGENELGGNTVFVLGAGGRNYYYAHLDSYAPSLAVGDYVTPETVLGYVGTTGNAAGTPPHLHFGMYTSGGAINPLPLMRGAINRPAAPPALIHNERN